MVELLPGRQHAHEHVAVRRDRCRKASIVNYAT